MRDFIFLWIDNKKGIHIHMRYYNGFAFQKRIYIKLIGRNRVEFRLNFHEHLWFVFDIIPILNALSSVEQIILDGKSKRADPM